MSTGTIETRPRREEADMLRAERGADWVATSVKKTVQANTAGPVEVGEVRSIDMFGERNAVTVRGILTGQTNRGRVTIERGGQVRFARNDGMITCTEWKAWMAGLTVEVALDGVAKKIIINHATSIVFQGGRASLLQNGKPETLSPELQKIGPIEWRTARSREPEGSIVGFAQDGARIVCNPSNGSVLLDGRKDPK